MKKGGHLLQHPPLSLNDDTLSNSIQNRHSSRARTCDSRIKGALLYQLSYRVLCGGNHRFIFLNDFFLSNSCDTIFPSFDWMESLSFFKEDK